MDNICVTIESLAQGGEGVAHLPDGRAVFVQDACPGDMALITLTEEHPRWARAVIEEIIAPSPDRIVPRCPYIGSCGGCQWQHIAYERQLVAKRQAVIDALSHIGGLTNPDVRETIASPRQFGYRNKLELSPVITDRTFALGLSRAHSSQIVPVESCMLLPTSAARLPKALTGTLRFLMSRGAPEILRAALRVSTSGEIAVDIWTAGTHFPRAAAGQIIAQATGATSVTRTILRSSSVRHDISRVEVLSGSGRWHEKLGDDTYVVSAPSFFQVNSSAAVLLRMEALRVLEADSTMRVADLYSGVGTFTLPLCRVSGEVVAVETSRYALEDLRSNLKAAGVNAEVIAGDAAYVLPTLGHIDAAVIDPPRSGLSNKALAALANSGIPQLVYVSCNPVTLARDTKRLMAAGYDPHVFVPVDLFPQTYHVETIVLMSRVRQ